MRMLRNHQRRGERMIRWRTEPSPTYRWRLGHPYDEDRYFKTRKDAIEWLALTSEIVIEEVSQNGKRDD